MPAAVAQAVADPAAPAAGSVGVLGRLLPLFAILTFIFYFMVIRPQDKKLKDQKTFLDSLKKGETVATSGGIIARIAAIEKDHVLLDLGANVKIKVEAAHVVKRAS